LQKKILMLVERPQADVYLLARRNIIFNNWVKDAGWWPDYQPRLFKKNKLRWNETIHSRPDFFGSTQRLPANKANAIIHHNYQTISQFIQRLDRYTGIQAEQTLFLGEAHESTSIRAFYQELSQRLFVLKGVDSCHGTILSFLQALSEFVVVAKRWEAVGFPDQKQPQASVEALKQMQQVLAYWIADYKIKHSRGLNKLRWQVRRKLKI
jgi:hypothetical protein